jgi:hypothetical protein
MAAVTDWADPPLPAEAHAVELPYVVVGPQTKRYAVEWLFGVTAAARLALVVAIAVAAFVVTLGGLLLPLPTDAAAHTLEGMIAMTIAASNASDGRSI